MPPSPRLQVDRDLHALKADALVVSARIGRAGGGEAEEQQATIKRMIDLVDESLESSTEDFKLTITDIVDDIEVWGSVGDGEVGKGGCFEELRGGITAGGPNKTPPPPLQMDRSQVEDRVVKALYTAKPPLPPSLCKP